MSARLLAALVCLLNFGPSIGRAGSLPSPDHKVVLYLRSDQPQDAPTVTAMKHELETQLKAGDYQVQWRTLGASNGSEDGFVAIIEMRGACHAPKPGASLNPVSAGASLASTAVQDGQVLPFSWIYCQTLSEMLAPALASTKSSQRDFLYGRAMGRVLAHELYHVLSNERAHENGGVAKSSFSASDVLKDDFTLGESALLRMHAPDSGDNDADAGESAAGR